MAKKQIVGYDEAENSSRCQEHRKLAKTIQFFISNVARRMIAQIDKKYLKFKSTWQETVKQLKQNAIKLLEKEKCPNRRMQIQQNANRAKRNFLQKREQEFIVLTRRKIQNLVLRLCKFLSERQPLANNQRIDLHDLVYQMLRVEVRKIKRIV